MVRDREFESTDDNYKVAYRLSKKVKYLTFGDPGGSKSLTGSLDAEYLVNGAIKRVCIKKDIIKSHVGFPKPYYLTFGDLEGSRSQTETL